MTIVGDMPAWLAVSLLSRAISDIVFEETGSTFHNGQEWSVGETPGRYDPNTRAKRASLTIHLPPYVSG